MKRLGAVVGAAIAAGMLGAVTAFACVSVAAVQSVSPSSGPPGTHVTVNYNGFDSMGNYMTNGTTKVYFGGETHGVLVATVATAKNFTVAFAVPASAATGNYLIEAVATGRNPDTGQTSREVSRTIFAVTAPVPGAHGAQGPIVQQAPGSIQIPQADEVKTVTVDQAVTRPDGGQPAVGAPGAQQAPVAPGQAVTLASQSVGSAVGLILMLLGVVVLGTAVAAAAAVAVGRVHQPQRQAEKQRI